MNAFRGVFFGLLFSILFFWAPVVALVILF